MTYLFPNTLFIVSVYALQLSIKLILVLYPRLSLAIKGFVLKFTMSTLTGIKHFLMKRIQIIYIEILDIVYVDIIQGL